MGLLLRLLLVLLIIGPLIAAGVTMNVWWMPVTVIGAASAVFLGLGVLAAAQEEDDPMWGARRCLECGATVADGVTVCPHCKSVQIGTEIELLAAHMPEEGRFQNRLMQDRAQQFARQPSFWFPKQFWVTVSWWVTGVSAGMDIDPSDPADMRWWSSRLLIVAAFFGTLGVAGHFHAWSMGIAALLAIGSTSYAVAVFGPHSRTERFATLSTADSRRPLPTYRDS